MPSHPADAHAPHVGMQDEHDLMARIQAGDTEAFDTLFARYWVPLCAFAARYTSSRDSAQDLVQEVFTRLWIRRTSLTIHTSVRAYLYAMVRSAALHQIEHTGVEHRWGKVFSASGVVPAMGNARASVDVQMENDELAAALDRAMNALSPRVQQVAILRWRDGLGRGDIADLLGISAKTVDNQLAVALRTLREILSARDRARGE